MSESAEFIRVEDLHKLLDFFSRNSYKARESDVGDKILRQCLALFGKDYKYSVINNNNGELCSHYPGQLVLLEYGREPALNKAENVECIYDLGKIRDLFIKARFARCRARFPIPVILYEGKHICRSATISGGAEIYGRSGFDFFFTGGESIPGEEAAAELGNTEWQLFNRIRGQDIRLLKTFGVKTICDLMMEKKKVKFGMNVTSSEKVDKENRYSDFRILCTPYPGCEFFREWKENNYSADGMRFDWNQGYVDSALDIPPDPVTTQVVTNWSEYKEWDLVRLTQNYLKLLLKYMSEGEGGLLVHCISGWDRTPLFISLLRLSLWADGAIHKSLSAIEILYLTIAYDWYLFGHNLPDRLNKGEEIFAFCFSFLKHITSEEFTVNKGKRTRSTSGTDSESNFDGVLFDSDNQNLTNHRGSNTSISSASSATSAKSSVENVPSVFMSHEEEVAMSHANGNAASVPLAGVHRRSPVSRITSHTMSARSNPVAVPAIKKTRSNSGSSACGSWQIISGNGSLRDTISSYESTRSTPSDVSQSGHSPSCCLYHECADHTDDMSRKRKLETVRRLFRSVSLATGDFKNGTEVSGIGVLLDHFAEKVGIRSRTGLV